MHVLHVCQLYRPVPSGAARYFVEVGERLVQEGHRVTVLTTDAFDLEHLWAAGRRSIAEHEDNHHGVQVRRFPVRRLVDAALAYAALRRLMVELTRLPLPRALHLALLYRLARVTPRLPDLAAYLHHTPDLHDVALVHTTNITLDFMILPVLDWARQRGIPHICTPFLHLGEPGNRQVVRYYSLPHQIDLLRRSAAVITQTSLERRFLAAAGVPDDLMHTIGVGVTPSELQGGDGARFRRSHNIAPAVPIVLTLGVAAYDKGTVHTVQAMQRYWSQGGVAVWVQAGPLMEHFEQLQRSLPATDRAQMRVLGFVDDQTRLDALAAANVLVLPSRTDSFGIVYLEAWCYGVPVVGAQAGGVPDVIDHGTNGLLVPFGDVATLTATIARLLRDRELARALGAAGRAKMLRSLTWAQKYAEVRAVYGQVARRTP
ncbi:MAG: glycosyltransferase family 4 protein [Chloroflexaceae bacterium]|nr:glycosyltransferase family 4 protein [Chloroflexaceae bacterium]